MRNHCFFIRGNKVCLKFGRLVKDRSDLFIEIINVRMTFKWIVHDSQIFDT